ncbi:MAG: sugar phosphate isomerase/epimerase [Kiritimatiellae bacterium]|nr:sugar phosphate isomerase/epimerase [Kiritimatiellia bacterium]
MGKIKICGIADEAGQPIDVQIKAHKELGWDMIELRQVDNTNVTELTDKEFDKVYAALTEAGIKVPSFASPLCNWARPITTDFSVDVEELKRAIPRMQRLGAKTIRIMSYTNVKENPWSQADWKKEVVRRIKELARMAGDGGITLAHENCHGWAGQSPDTMVELIKSVDSPHLKLLLDTGNFSGKRGESWAMYEKIRPHIAYVHMKDRNEEKATFPGEGNSEVKRIAKALIDSGYDGIMSIEPHIAAVIHTGKTSSPEVLYETYIEYGKKATAIVNEANAAGP